MNPLQLIGDRDTVLALSLGGIPGEVATDAGAARAALERHRQEIAGAGGMARQPSLLLITSGVARLIRDLLAELILDPEAPLILEIPGFGEAGGEAGAEKFVRRVLGLSS